MTKAELEGILLSSLGSGRVDVELDPSHIDSAITMALLMFSVYAPVEYSINLTAADGQTKFDLTSLGSDVVITQVNRSGTSITPNIDPFSFESYISQKGYDIVDVAILQNYVETVNQTLGKEFQWRFEYPFLYLNKPLLAGEMLEVKYTKPYQSVEEVPIKYLPFFIRYAKAELKEILARIRGKYRGMPASEGTVEMDYSDLLSEAQTEKQEALKELKRVSQRGIFIVG